MWSETKRRLGELASLLSCVCNILIGTGDRELTLSAGSALLAEAGRTPCARRYGRLLAGAIDRVWRLAGDPRHTAAALEAHRAVLLKLAADKAARTGEAARG